MSIELIVALSVAALTLIIFGTLATVVFRKKVPRKLKVEYFTEKWRELQAFCRDKATWRQAVISADQLLDIALKKRRFKGKSTGERLVSAQRLFTNNDAVWFAHNLYKKVVADEDARLKEADVKAALVAFRQALRDIGALDNGESRSSK